MNAPMDLFPFETPQVMLISRVSTRWESTFTSRFNFIVSLTLFFFLSLFFLPLFATCLILSSFFLVMGVALTERLELEKSLDLLELEWIFPEYAQRRQNLSFELILNNRSQRYLHRLEVAFRAPSGISPPIHTDLIAGGSLTLQGQWLCDHLLSGHLWGVELNLTDRWGLVIATRHWVHERSISIKPAPPLISWSSLRRQLPKGIHAAQEVSAWRQRGDEGDFSELRAYQTGDSWRQVAWRASARRGELMTRVLERGEERRVVIAIDLGPMMRTPLNTKSQETAVDFALDLLAGWIPQMRHELISVIAFDHRVLSSIPMMSPTQVRKRLNSLIQYAVRPLDADCTLETLDELWSQVADYLEWSGRIEFQSHLVDHISHYAFSSHLLTSSYQLGVVSGYLDRVQLSAPLPSPTLDEIKLHDRLRRFAHEIGITLTPPLFRTPDQLCSGLREVISLAERSHARELIILSHKRRLQSSSNPSILNSWSRNKGALIALNIEEIALRSISRDLASDLNWYVSS